VQVKPQLMSLFGLNIQGDFGGITCYRSARQRFTWFAATTPKIPPTIPAQQQRAKWKRIAQLWSSMQPENRVAWTAAARKLRLRITGFNLFIHCFSTNDQPLLDTINAQAGSTLSLQTTNAFPTE